jgi:hypothetical protein
MTKQQIEAMTDEELMKLWQKLTNEAKKRGLERFMAV